MGIKSGEIGKTFRYGTSFDMSSGSAEFELHFTSPSGANDFDIVDSDSRITAPAVAISGSFAASEYMEFTTLAADFPEAGEWSVCGQYVDATPVKFFGDPATFTVGAAC